MVVASSLGVKKKRQRNGEMIVNENKVSVMQDKLVLQIYYIA